MNILTSEERSDYEQDGFIIIRNLFSEDEITLLGQTARADNEMDKSSSSMDDGEGNAVRLALWNHPGDGIYGMITRCRKLVDRVEDLLDDEAYHYHSKMVLKDAKVGGAWAWHGPRENAPGAISWGPEQVGLFGKIAVSSFPTSYS